jgi:hypothetical protein
MRRQAAYVKLLLFVCIMLILAPNLKAESDITSQVKAAVKNEITRLLQQIDLPEFAKRIPDDEFIVNAYRLIYERKPDEFEFYCCKSLFAKNHLTRGKLLALLMAGTANEITWEQCRTLLQRDPVNFLKNTVNSKADVQTLKNASRETIVHAYKKRMEAHKSRSFQNKAILNATPSVTNTSVSASSSVTASSRSVSVAYEAYNTYFGYLHAHTGYSDGEGTPAEAYRYARDYGKLDYFAVTDHGEELIFWPWEDKWDKIKSAADACYVPDSYVTLWGFEWSNPLLGHINVINTDDYTHCLSNITPGDLYDWLKARPGGFATYNHPGDYDLIDTEFEHLEMTGTGVIPQMVGIETWNGTNSFDQYFYQNGWKNCDYSYMDTGNRNGWRLGALGGQDNHVKNWGTLNQFRTAVLAKRLTREAIIDAYRNRRFYATEDRDLYLDFRCSGYPMGSQLTGVSRNFTVTLSDQSNDTFVEARLYRNGELIAVNPLSGSSCQTCFTDNQNNEKAYYYVVVRQNDDNDGNGRNDEAISAPIWIE